MVKNVTNNISARRILKADQQVPEENASLDSRAKQSNHTPTKLKSRRRSIPKSKRAKKGPRQTKTILEE